MELYTGSLRCTRFWPTLLSRIPNTRSMSKGNRCGGIRGHYLPSNFVPIRITDRVFLLHEIDVSFVGSFGGCTRISGWMVNMWEIVSGVTGCTPAGSPV